MGRARSILKRAAAWPRLELVRSVIRRRAAGLGFSPRDLQRFEAYLATHVGLRRADYREPLQQPPNYFPGLLARPVHDARGFSWTPRLVDAFPAVRDELLELSARRALRPQVQGMADGGGWDLVYLAAGGHPVEETRRACPRAAALVDALPGGGRAGQAYLSVVRAKSHIQRHFGPTNARLRCHLGLVVPEGCRIRIGTGTYRWREGECLVFDDSFEHEVWNDADRDRLVLIIDVWHPELMPAEQWAIDAARQLRFGLKDVLHA